MKTLPLDARIFLEALLEAGLNEPPAPYGKDPEEMECSELLRLYTAVRRRMKELGIKEPRAAENSSPERLRITRDYRIFLVERGEEIRLQPLVKTVFIFFLKHPEGVPFKEMETHREELYSIYSRITGRTDIRAISRSIGRLSDTEDNSIHEKCSVLRSRLLSYFDEGVIDRYVISGGYGEPRRISLDRIFIIWE